MIGKQLLMNIIDQAMWLSPEVFKKTQELNTLMFSLDPNGDIIKFGKENYLKIVEIRENLERLLVIDLIELHDIKRFLKRKSIVETGLREVQR